MCGQKGFVKFFIAGRLGRVKFDVKTLEIRIKDNRGEIINLNLQSSGPP